MIKRILVALSGTPCTESAIAHGVALAQEHDAQLTTAESFWPHFLHHQRQ